MGWIDLNIKRILTVTKKEFEELFESLGIDKNKYFPKHRFLNAIKRFINFYFIYPVKCKNNMIVNSYIPEIDDCKNIHKISNKELDDFLTRLGISAFKENSLNIDISRYDKFFEKYTTKKGFTEDEEYKCEKCIYHNPNKFSLNGYGEELPDFCETGSEYYCCVTGYSLFKER
jgi:hypothetical protein